MKFQSTIAYPIQAPPVGLFNAGQSVPTVRRQTVNTESGKSIDIIPGGISESLAVTLHQLYVTWGGLTESGKLEIRSFNEDSPLTIFLTIPSGNLILPCFDEVKLLSRYGLRAVSSSTGGEYSITAHYTIKEQ